MQTNFDKGTTAGHLCFFYKDEQERLELITDYFRQGLLNKELCIFATPHSKEQTKQDFLRHGLDIDGALKNGEVLIYEMESTYLPHGEFVADYMLGNVQSFINDAKAQGFNGLRTAGEMSWLADHPESEGEVLMYEHKVNTLDPSDFSFIGFCLYDSNSTHKKLAEGLEKSHPTLFFDGKLVKSPLYTPIWASSSPSNWNPICTGIVHWMQFSRVETRVRYSTAED